MNIAARILAFVVIGLIPVAFLQQCQVKSLGAVLDTTKQQLARSQADLEAAVQAEKENTRTINDLRGEIELRDRMAAEQLKRSKAVIQELNRARKQLQEKADNDKTLRDYLDSDIHAFVAEWLWVGSSDPGGGEKGGSAPVAAAQLDGAYIQAYEPVTHEKGWDWARETDKALDSCNADKAALREWVRKHAPVGELWGSEGKK